MLNIVFLNKNRIWYILPMAFCSFEVKYHKEMGCSEISQRT